MVEVVTTLSFTVTHQPDPRSTRIRGSYGDIDDDVQRDLERTFGAVVNADEHGFDVDLQYARTIAHRLNARGAGEVWFQPTTPLVPMEAIIDEAARLARERLDWPVVSIELIHEKSHPVFEDDFDALTLQATCQTRVTQSGPIDRRSKDQLQSD